MANIPQPLSTQELERCLSLWRSGEALAMPTETVYGLAVDATNADAVELVYRLKGRPSHNPLILHVANAEMAQRYVEWNVLAERLASLYWPGALTLVLPKKAEADIAPACAPNTDRLAVRCPAHPIAQQLLRAFDGAIAAPSANRSGRISPTQSTHVREEFADTDLHIVEGGACAQGLESTVLWVGDDHVAILRPGGITKEMLEAKDIAVGQREEDVSALSAPGQLTSHYAPRLSVRLNAEGAREGEAFIGFGPTELPCAYNLSESGDLTEAAQHLFAHLRAADQPEKYSAIAVMHIPEGGVGSAINDRLKRAAAERN